MTKGKGWKDVTFDSCQHPGRKGTLQHGTRWYNQKGEWDEIKKKEKRD